MDFYRTINAILMVEVRLCSLEKAFQMGSPPKETTKKMLDLQMK